MRVLSSYSQTFDNAASGYGAVIYQRWMMAGYAWEDFDAAGIDEVMPSTPPNTYIYADPNNAELWRDFLRFYKDFLGDDSEQWEPRKLAFQIVINDLLVHLRDSCHEACRRKDEQE